MDKLFVAGKFAVIAHDPQVDIYQDDPYVGCEVVEAVDEQEAIDNSELGKYEYHYHCSAYQVPDDTPLGDHDEPPEALLHEL